MADKGKPWSFDGDGKLFRLVAEAHRIRLAHLFDPVLAVHTSLVEPLAPPDHGRLRGDAAAAAAAIPAGGRPGRRQDDHGRPVDEGDDRARRSAAMPRRLPGQSGRAVAGRAVSPLSPEVRHPHQRQARSLGDRQLVSRHESCDRPARQALPQRRRPGEAARARLPMGPGRLRRGAQALGDVLRRRGEVHEAVQARSASLRHHAPLPADDRDPAQRQGGGLPAVHGASRRRPIRGQVPRRRARQRRQRSDAADGEGEAAEVRRDAALSRANRDDGPLQAVRAPRPNSTSRSPTTCGRSGARPTI